MALSAIDMALLRSFSKWFMATMHARKQNEAFHEPLTQTLSPPDGERGTAVNHLQRTGEVHLKAGFRRASMDEYYW